METSTVLFIPSASSAQPELAPKIRPYPTAQTTTGASVTIRLLFRFSFTAFSGSGAGLPGPIRTGKAPAPVTPWGPSDRYRFD